MILAQLILCLCNLIVAEEIISPGAVQPEAYLIRLRTELYTDILYKSCPHLLVHDTFLGKREIIGYNEKMIQGHTLAVEKKIYNHIQKLLRQCYRPSADVGTTIQSSPLTTTQADPVLVPKKITSTIKVVSTAPTIISTTILMQYTTTTIPTTTTAQKTTTTKSMNASTPTVMATGIDTTTADNLSTSTAATDAVTTTPISTMLDATTSMHIRLPSPNLTSSQTASMSDHQLPQQCTSNSTLNLNESWRNNYMHRNPTYDDDVLILKPGQTWFRLTEAAGKLLKNSCPMRYSCGSTGAYWSDSRLPSLVGESVNISLFESYSRDGTSRCKVSRFRGVATRCSTERGGVVYRMDDPMNGFDDTVCGMD